MTVSIGRAGLNPQIVEVSRFEFEGGDQVKLSGWLRGGTSMETLVAVREQMLGLVDNRDEPVVPVVWSQDSSVDGFYRVRSVGLGTEPRMKLDSSSVVPWDCVLERVSSYASPLFDSRLLHALRSGSAVTSASASALHGLVPATTMYRRGTSVVGSLSTRSVADGGAVYVGAWAASSSQLSAEWSAPPSGWYDGAARIERRVDGGQWVPVTGKFFPGDVDPNADWRISNGLVRVYPRADVLGGTGAAVEAWNGTAWVSLNVLSFADVGFTGVTVTRNDPGEVTVAARIEGAGAVVTFTVRRGDRLASGTYSAPGSTALLVSVFAGGASQTITGGVRLTANDADGNRWVLATAGGTLGADASAPFLPNVANNSGSFVDFGFGHEINGSSSTGIDTAQALANQYAAYVSERVDAANP